MWVLQRWVTFWIEYAKAVRAYPSEPGIVEQAWLKLRALTIDPHRQAKRIEQAAMLELAMVDEQLVQVVAKISSSGLMTTEDLIQIQRAGIALQIRPIGWRNDR